MVLLLCPGAGATGKLHPDLSVDQLQINAEIFASARFEAGQHAGFAMSQQFFRHRRSDFFMGEGFPDHHFAAAAPFAATVAFGGFDDLAAAERTIRQSGRYRARLTLVSKIACLPLWVQRQPSLKDLVIDMNGISRVGLEVLQQLTSHLVVDLDAEDLFPQNKTTSLFPSATAVPLPAFDYSMAA